MKIMRTLNQLVVKDQLKSIITTNAKKLLAVMYTFQSLNSQFLTECVEVVESNHVEKGVMTFSWH